MTRKQNYISYLVCTLGAVLIIYLAFFGFESQQDDDAIRLDANYLAQVTFAELAQKLDNASNAKQIISRIYENQNAAQGYQKLSALSLITAIGTGKNPEAMAIAMLLIDKGADIDDAASDASPIKIATESYLKTLTDPSATNNKQALAQHLEMMALLLAFQANPNRHDKDELPLLIRLVRVGLSARPAIDLFISHKAYIDITDSNGNTPLMYVRNLKMAQLLLRGGADFSLGNRFGTDALMHAANVNRENDALWLFPEHEKTNIAKTMKMVNLYLILGLDPEREDKGAMPKAALDYSYIYNKAGQRKLAPTKITTLLTSYIESRENLEQLLDVPLLLNHKYMRRASFFQINQLLVGGANANIRNAAGQTPLMIAGIYNNRRAIQALIRRGADITARDYRGNPVKLP